MYIYISVCFPVLSILQKIIMIIGMTIILNFFFFFFLPSDTLVSMNVSHSERPCLRELCHLDEAGSWSGLPGSGETQDCLRWNQRKHGQWGHLYMTNYSRNYLQ